MNDKSEKTKNNPNSRAEVSSLVKLTTTRRNILGVVGISAIAGCSDSDTDETDNSEISESADGEDTPTESAINPAEIISQHSEQLLTLSYSFILNYQGEESAPDNEQQIEYRYGEDGLAELNKETTIEDGVEELAQLYSESNVVANVTFDDHDPITFKLREGENTHKQLTGESLFDFYLPGAIFDESHEEEGSENSSSVTVYEITSHRSYDSLGGLLKVDDEGLIKLFQFEWLDSQSEEHWIEFDLTDVGETSIDVASEFEIDN